MAYDQNADYQAPRRHYYGQAQQQAPVQQQQYQQQQNYNDYGYNEGYDRQYQQRGAPHTQQANHAQQYGEMNPYAQDLDPRYDDRRAYEGGQENGVGYQQQYGRNYEQEHNGYAKRQNGQDQRSHNDHVQQERHYDPRYQQRPGRVEHSGLPQQPAPRAQQPSRDQQSYQPQPQSQTRPPAPNDGYSRPQQSADAVRFEPRTNGTTQSSHPARQPEPPQQLPPKKMTMQEWKALEKAKMQNDAKRPETLAQDNAFPTFPATKKKESSRSGGLSAMSGRSSEDQPRPSTASSLRPDDRRPGMSRDNSYKKDASNLEQLRPSIDHKPFSFEPQPNRPSMDSQHRPHHHQERAGTPGAEHRQQQQQQQQQQQMRVAPPSQHDPRLAQRADPSETSHSQSLRSPPQQQSRVAALELRPLETSQAQYRTPAAMDHQPLSPTQGIPRPASSNSHRPVARPYAQLQQQPSSPLGQFSRSLHDAPPERHERSNFKAELHHGVPEQPQHHPQQSTLSNFYDDYYDDAGQDNATSASSARAPLTREEEIEAEMPDFDSAAPGQTSSLYKRNQPAERAATHAPAKPTSPTSSMPTSARGDPSSGFDFGFAGHNTQQQQHHQQQQYPTNGRSANQFAQPIQPPFANETYGRRSMDDARQMPYRGPPQPRGPPQRFYANEPGPLSPPVRPDYDRQQTTWSDPGQQRGPSAPPMRSGLQEPPRQGQIPGAAPPLTQQRSAPNGPEKRPSNPDALPAHPTPVRPGLINETVNQAPRPAPVRNYNNVSGPSQQSRAPSQEVTTASAPVTQAELQKLRAAVEANPQSNKTALLYAKKLVEAATVLASDGGRADAKTTAKNRERYIMDAYKRIKKLTAVGYPDAQFYLADCYGQGLLGLDVDTKEAFKLYQAAAKSGHSAAAYRTAVCCEMGAEDGGGTSRDYPKAVQWYRRAAALGETAAMFKVGMIGLKGLLGQPRNLGDAVIWLKRSVERADRDNPHALHELGLLYESANSTPETRHKIIPDDAYALSLLRQAADYGYKQSQFRLGQAYEYGQLGLPIDHRASISWYSKAAAQGEHQAELALSGWYLTGAPGILEHSDTEAYLWARKAAQAEPPLSKAMFAMGYFSETGIGCPVNLDEAKRWYGRAASYKHPKAQERLEVIRRGGKGGKAAQNGKLTRKDQKRDEAECAVM